MTRYLTSTERQIRPKVQVVEYQYFVCFDWRGQSITRWFKTYSERDQYAEELVHCYRVTIHEKGHEVIKP